MSSCVHRTRGPYRGLVPYREDDEPYFFGRGTESKAIFDRLFAGRLTIVYGTSGVGKSSILRAGVVPLLRRQPKALPVLITDWSGTPTSTVDRALEAAGLQRSPEDSLESCLRQAVETHQRYVMVILDQFEEVLRDAGRTDEELDLLFDAIVSLCADDEGVSFVIALRADALANIDRLLRRLDDSSTPETYRVEAITRQSAEDAIYGPVLRYNEDHATTVSIEPALVDAVLGVAENDTARAVHLALGATDEIDLPFLQIVMDTIWKAEREPLPPTSDVLRADTLRRLGGTQKIVADHVRRILGALSTPDRRLAALVLERLVSPTGAKVPFSAEDLAKLTETSVDDVRRVLDGMSSGESRLLSTTEGSRGSFRYELFHDRLSGPIDAWTKEQRAEEGAAYRNRVLAIATVAAVVLAVVVGFVVAHFAGEPEPPRATIQAVTISGDVGLGLDATRLFDGDDSTALLIDVGNEREFKIEVTFIEVIEIVDVQVVPSTDASVLAPVPDAAWIEGTRIEVPIADDRPIGRGAYGETQQLTLIVRSKEFDRVVQIAELKFWRNE